MLKTEKKNTPKSKDYSIYNKSRIIIALPTVGQRIKGRGRRAEFCAGNPARLTHELSHVSCSLCSTFF